MRECQILIAREISSQTAKKSIISDAILKSRTLVQEGVQLSTSLIHQKVLPNMALSMLAIGVETGEMDKIVSKVADFYEDERERWSKHRLQCWNPQ